MGKKYVYYQQSVFYLVKCHVSENNQGSKPHDMICHVSEGLCLLCNRKTRIWGKTPSAAVVFHTAQGQWASLCVFQYVYHLVHTFGHTLRIPSASLHGMQ